MGASLGMRVLVLLAYSPPDDDSFREIRPLLASRLQTRYHRSLPGVYYSDTAHGSNRGDTGGGSKRNESEIRKSRSAKALMDYIALRRHTQEFPVSGTVT
ncbi:MAG TPA: hypothetical protein VGY58_09750 [Gemmataceae bacterium]|jgi:hypothetical protein|nr:hypothetical protein [Gemmataceae bacterium]